LFLMLGVEPREEFFECTETNYRYKFNKRLEWVKLSELKKGDLVVILKQLDIEGKPYPIEGFDTLKETTD